MIFLPAKRKEEELLWQMLWRDSSTCTAAASSYTLSQ